MRSSAIRQLASSRNASRIAAAFFEQTVQIWDWQSGEQAIQFDTVLDFGGSRLALNPTGDLCAAAALHKGKRGGVACYDAGTGGILWHRTDIRHTQILGFASRGETVWCGVEYGSLVALSSASGVTLMKGQREEEPIWLVKSGDPS